jgi:hypothetical protein
MANKCTESCLSSFVESRLWEAYENWTWARRDAPQLLFLRCLSVGWDWHSPGHRRGKCKTAAFPKLLTFRQAGMVSPVTMSRPSQRTAAAPCLLLGIKDSLKEDTRLFCFELLLLVFGWREAVWYGRLWKGKGLLKGKWIEGRIAEGKELLKENC